LLARYNLNLQLIKKGGGGEKTYIVWITKHDGEPKKKVNSKQWFHLVGVSCWIRVVIELRINASMLVEQLFIFPSISIFGPR
jgi:hypothetical protein